METPRWKDRRAMFISQHRCANCGAKDEYTLSGRKQCKKCCDRGKAYRNGYRHPREVESEQERKEKLRKYKREWQKDLRNWRKEHNQCIECGDKDALTMAGRTLCQSCWEKRYKKPFVSKEQRRLEIGQTTKPINRSERPDYGLCYICGNPITESYRLCEHCLGTIRKSVEKASEARKQHVWRKY